MAKVCLVSSAGGHLTQVVSIAGELQGEHDFILCVTGFEGVRQKGQFEGVSSVYLAPVFWEYQIPFGVILSLLASLWVFVRVMRSERPDYLVTTGAEIAIPALLVNRLFFRRPSLFIESVSRIDAPSLTGRIAYHLADRVFVQWPGLLRRYGPRAEYHGRLL